MQIWKRHTWQLRKKMGKHNASWKEAKIANGGKNRKRIHGRNRCKLEGGDTICGEYRQMKCNQGKGKMPNAFAFACLNLRYIFIFDFYLFCIAFLHLHFLCIYEFLFFAYSFCSCFLFAFLRSFFCITCSIFSRFQFSKISPQGADTNIEGFSHCHSFSFKPIWDCESWRIVGAGARGKICDIPRHSGYWWLLVGGVMKLGGWWPGSDRVFPENPGQVYALFLITREAKQKSRFRLSVAHMETRWP